MKVICIDASNTSGINEGQVYEVEEKQMCDCGAQYRLAIIRTQPTRCPHCNALNIDAYFWQHRFAPLSSIDEKEFERNYNLQTINH